MSIALYREFRPKTFDEVVGQEHITRTLQNQIKTGQTTHAYLFTGARGTGKTSCAKIFSKAINCLSPKNGSPCGECEVCKALNEVNTDVMEIDAASNNRVDEIRDLREMVKYPPVIGKKKVYIIDEVHMLTESAFNALLKTLEEPPSYVVFILATTEVHKIPATILSRCTRFDFRLLSIEELVGQLKTIFNSRQVSYDEESLFVIAKQGEGSSRDTLSIADSVLAYCNGKIEYSKTLEVLGLSRASVISKIVDGIADGSAEKIFKGVSETLRAGKNISVLCKEMAEYFKNLILINNGISDAETLNVMPSDIEEYVRISKRFNLTKLKEAFEKFSRIELDLKGSLNPRNLFEATCISLIEDKLDLTPIKNVEPPASVSEPKASEEVEKVEKIEKVEERETFNENVNAQKSEEKKIVDTINEDTDLDSGRIWGEALIRVKEKNMFAFSASLKNVYEVSIKRNTLILHTNDNSAFQSLNSLDKKEVILNILKDMNKNIDEIDVVYDENKRSQQDIIKELKETFLDKIKIK